jgi:large subunit ribosomal protein L32
LYRANLLLLLLRDFVIFKLSPTAKMAAIAVRPFASTSTGSSFLGALNAGVQSLLQGPASSLLDLLPPIILAVPKSKVSHSRKSMRSANKGLKEKISQSISCLAAFSPLKLG